MVTAQSRSTGHGSDTKASASRGHAHRAGTLHVHERGERNTRMDFLPVYGDEGWGENGLPSEFQAPENESHHVVLDESEYISRLSEI